MANTVIQVEPRTFWRLTPVELAQMMDGAVEREERAWFRTAWEVAHLMNVSGKTLKRDITPDRLLGRQKRVTRAIDPAADFEVMWSRLKERSQGSE